MLEFAIFLLSYINKLSQNLPLLVYNIMTFHHLPKVSKCTSKTGSDHKVWIHTTLDVPFYGIHLFCPRQSLEFQNIFFLSLNISSSSVFSSFLQPIVCSIFFVLNPINTCISELGQITHFSINTITNGK